VSAADAAQSAGLTRLAAIIGGSAGNLVEWYDWYAYSAAALYFAPMFFPKGNLTAQLLQSAAVFAVGFFVRPLGAWIMGRYADRAGRKAALTLSVAMMSAGSMVIALTPGAARIGVAAPLILLAARILQGLSLGGEYGASATFMSEIAGRAHRGFWSSFNYVTIIGGQLVALAVLMILQRLLPAGAMAAWGWRIPFLIGAALALVVFWLRRNLPETNSFVNAVAADAERGSTRLLLTRYPRETLTILGLTSGGSMLFYVYATYMQKFLTNSAGFSKDQATALSAATLLAFMAAQPVCGWLSDRIGRRTMLLIAFGGSTLLVWPVMTRIATAGSIVEAFFLILAALLFVSAYTSISAVVKEELFPVNVRSLGVGLPYAVANATFGGTAEYVALWFKSVGAESGFYFYAAALSGISLLVAIGMTDTRAHDRILED